LQIEELTEELTLSKDEEYIKGTMYMQILYIGKSQNVDDMFIRQQRPKIIIIQYFTVWTLEP